MADNGKLYSGFDKDFPLKMAKLCKYADVILPNISEAAFMTGMPLQDRRLYICRYFQKF